MLRSNVREIAGIYNYAFVSDDRSLTRTASLMLLHLDPNATKPDGILNEQAWILLVFIYLFFHRIQLILGDIGEIPGFQAEFCYGSGFCLP